MKPAARVYRLGRACASLFLCALLAGRSSAAVFNVTGTGDSGAGTLRQGVLDAVAAGGANTVAWGAGSGGAITLLSSLAAVPDGTTFDVSAAPAAATIAGSDYFIPLSGALTFHNTNAGQDAAVSSYFHGAGSLRKTGAGTLVLTGPNAHAGGTTVSGGTLNVNADAALGSAAALLTLDGGTLKTSASSVFTRPVSLGAANGAFDSNGFDSVFYGTVSGAGSLTKTGAGILYIRGRNTYSGGTVITGGTINVIGDESLGDAAGTLTLNAGTIQTVLEMTIRRAVALAGAGTVDVTERITTITGTISGAGGLTKTGAGTLVLGAANTYAGGTTVNNGVLQLGVNNALPANMAVTVAAGGTLEMGSFTQSVSNATVAGTLRLTLQPSVTNLAATGTATLTGGTLVLTLPPQVVSAGQTFTPITAGVAVAGTFTGGIVSPAALRFTPTYNANNLVLTASLVPFDTLGANDNQDAVGLGLEPLRTGPTGDAATVIGELYALDAAKFRGALDQIGPVSLAAMAGIGMGASGVHASALSGRMAALAGRAGGGDAVAWSGPADAFPGPLVAEAGAGDVEPRAPRRPASYGLFATALYREGRLREANAPSGLQPGYAFNSAGFVAGADRSVGDGLAAGVAAGYLRGHSSIYAPGSGVVDSHSMRLGAYGTAFTESTHADAYLGGALDLLSTSRGIRFGGISRTATASPVGGELNADIGAGADLKAGALGTVSPFAGVGYDRMMVGAFTEAGAGVLNLSVKTQTAHSLRSRMGLKLSDKFDAGSTSFLPYASLGWRHEFLSQSRTIQAGVTGGTPFSVQTGDYARDGTMVGAGFAVNGETVGFRFDYAGDFRSHFMDSVVGLGARLRF